MGKHWVSVTLRELRETKNLTQKQLAKICDIHPNTIVRIERGEVSVSFITLERIFEALDHEIELQNND